MAKYISRHREQALMVPVHLDEQLQPGTFEHALDYVVDHHVDLKVFEARHRNDEVGRPAWDPAVMLKVILFGYSRGILSSRGLERACRENVVFLALSDGAHPHFTSIAEFVSSMKVEVEAVFQRILFLCSELDLVGLELLGVDGCKVSSNAAKEWSGTRAQLERKKAKIQAVVEDLTKRHRASDATEAGPASRRIEALEEKAERIAKFLAAHEKREGKRGRELQANITDPESAKMPSSRGMLQGYNGLAVVDGKAGVILHAEAFGSGQEHDLLSPMVEGVKKNLGVAGLDPEAVKRARLVADTNYHTETNCLLLEAEGIEGYIPDSRFRSRDPRFATAAQHRPERKRKYGIQDFRYDADRDRYVCPAGKGLRLEKRAAKKKGGYTMREYAARAEDCADCALRSSCLRRETVKQRRLSTVTENVRATRRMQDRIDTPEGREIYSKRMGVVEPIFANITFNKRMNRITLRGKVKATIQWMLYAIVHNLERVSHANYMSLAFG